MNKKEFDKLYLILQSLKMIVDLFRGLKYITLVIILFLFGFTSVYIGMCYLTFSNIFILDHKDIPTIEINEFILAVPNDSISYKNLKDTSQYKRIGLKPMFRPLYSNEIDTTIYLEKNRLKRIRPSIINPNSLRFKEENIIKEKTFVYLGLFYIFFVIIQGVVNDLFWMMFNSYHRPKAVGEIDDEADFDSTNNVSVKDKLILLTKKENILKIKSYLSPLFKSLKYSKRFRYQIIRGVVIGVIATLIVKLLGLS